MFLSGYDPSGTVRLGFWVIAKILVVVYIVATPSCSRFVLSPIATEPLPLSALAEAGLDEEATCPSSLAFASFLTIPRLYLPLLRLAPTSVLVPLLCSLESHLGGMAAAMSAYDLVLSPRRGSFSIQIRPVNSLFDFDLDRRR